MLVVFSIFVFLCGVCFADASSSVELDLYNWPQIREGEWLLKLYADWCPACKEYAPEWERIAEAASELNLKTAQLDCAAHSALAMIFTVSSLPTIFHVKDGIFREVKNVRQLPDFRKFLKSHTYETIEPQQWAYSPSAFYMPAVVHALNAGTSMVQLHRTLVAKGMPTVISLLVMSFVILGSGACFGLFLVMICEYCCPPRPQIMNVLQSGDQRPPPMVTKENDTDKDSVMGEDVEELNTDEDTDKDDEKHQSSLDAAAVRRRGGMDRQQQQ